MHEKKILHNDIKSDNIVLVKNGDLRTQINAISIDFGKACLVGEAHRKVLSEVEQTISRICIKITKWKL